MFLDQEIERLIIENSANEDGSGGKWSAGAKQIRERLCAIADLCASHFAGDFVEIGCSVGKTTLALAEVAYKHDRRVIAVDPWEPGTQNCKGGEYKEFKERTLPYESIIDVVRERSQGDVAVQYVNERDLCFAFVDGLHTRSAARKDLKTVSHCKGVIVVDDILCIRKVREAFSEFEAQRKITYEHIREGYIIP